MDDKKKIQQLEQRVNALQKVNEDNRKTIETLLTPPEETDCEVREIPYEEWKEKGVMYPGNLKNVWVNYMDRTIFMIVPKPDAMKKRSEEIKKMQPAL